MFGPHAGADFADHIVDGAGRSGGLGHVGDHPPERRLRTNRTQHASGWLEHPKVGATVAAGVQHQQAVDQQSAPINDRHSSTSIGHRRGEPAGQTKPVRVLGERPQTAQRDDLVGLIDAVITHRNRRARLHLTDAFQTSSLVCFNTLKFAATERICRVRTQFFTISPCRIEASLHPPGRVRNFAERHWGISVSGSTADRGRYHGDEPARGWYIRCGLRLGRSRLELETQLSRLLGVATVLITSLIEGPGHWLLPSARPRRAIQRLLTPDSFRHLVEMGVV